MTPLTTIDFPGHLAAVIFTQGCPWRCRFCHNGPLLDPNADTEITWDSVTDFLSRRRRLLDGVVFSGGEPTFWDNIAECIREVRTLGFKVALHTNGAYPDRLETLLKDRLLDWVALDIKAPFEDYERITGVPSSGVAARVSAEILLRAQIPCEFRTTVHPALLTPQDLLSIAKTLSKLGARRYVLQRCETEHSLDPVLRRKPHDLEEYILKLRPELENLFPHFELR